ncbi:DUF1064 domain-containing protein [Paraburkholderia sediminicola]|uniref:DUF1064 domain-containing protein n=1 Tax=Paraburkholderia sediminicola TaxID=458836 RepID=UPI0038BACCBB
MSKGIRFPESAIADGRVGTARIREEIAGIAANLASTAPAVLGEPISRLLGGNMLASQAVEPKRRSKFGNRQAVVDGITFDSEREAKRYCVLKLREKAREISNLRMQVPFVIVEATTIAGKRVRERIYIADFVYDLPHGSMVVEDSKGMQTPMYRIKRQLMKVVHNIEIQEI